jgi:hypothetical protein
MSSTAISGVGGTVSAPVTPISAAPQVAAKSQTAPAAQTPNGVQPILLVPTKPPLSAAVMAELLGHQLSPYGTSMGDYTRDQKPTDTTSGSSLAIPSAGSA